MYEGKSHTLFAKYALPQMIGLLFNSVYMIVDGVFIGNRLGRDAMAAAAVSVPLVEILIALSMAVATGAGVLISSRLGKGEKDKARSVFTLSVLCTAVMGVLISVLGNIWIHPLAELLGSTPAIHDEAIRYMWYIVTFSPFLLFSFLLSGLVRNDNRPKLAMFALMFGSVSNIVLDYVFMYPLNMGIAGAALATALGPIFSVLIMLPHFLRKRGDLYLVKFKVKLREIGSIYIFGFPSFIMEFTIGIITFVYNFAIVHYGFGEIGLAAYLVIGYLMLIILTLFLDGSGLAANLQLLYGNGRGKAEQSASALFYKNLSRCRNHMLSPDRFLLPRLLYDFQSGRYRTDQFHGEQEPAVFLRILPCRIQYPDDRLLAGKRKYRESAYGVFVAKSYQPPMPGFILASRWSRFRSSIVQKGNDPFPGSSDAADNNQRTRYERHRQP